MPVLKHLLKTLLFALVIFVAMYAGLTGYMRWQLEPVANPSKYEHVLGKRWHEHRLVSHFPRRLPEAAHSVRFHFRPGFMQGKPSIELRYGAPHEHIARLAKSHRSKATLIVRGGSSLFDSHPDSDLLPRKHFVTVATDELALGRLDELLPPDYEIMVLHPRARRSNPEGLHHGESAGMAISMQRDEVIFWAYSW